jgi:hypothetical protein
MPETMNTQERAAILRKREDSLAAYQRAMNSALEQPPCSREERAALDEANRHFQAAAEAEADYFQSLGRMSLSVCPLCNKPLFRTFDPYGLDGPWWQSSATPEEPIPCRHFCVLTGALSFNGKPPRGGNFEAHVGPQIPYVIPRLLEHPDMVAVVSRIQTADDYLAYPIAYFAKRRPPPQDLTAGWARTNYLYQTQLGEVRWRIPNDPWDFDLKPWIEQGKLYWCLESDGQLALKSEPPGNCPFIDLPGEQRPVIVQMNRYWCEPLPDGQILQPF